MKKEKKNKTDKRINTYTSKIQTNKIEINNKSFFKNQTTIIRRRKTTDKSH